MQVEIPIFRQIRRDLKLPPRAFQVWCSAIEFLDLVEWRELKLANIELDLEVDPSTVSRSLATLVERGYLCRFAEPGMSAVYRVPLSRADCGAAPDPVAARETGEPTVTRRTRPRVLSSGVI